ncbi:hypothetical protein CWI39_3473p0010 [Hamiltosporidium magnivora]|uniref:Uncharacterized protein n=1 Tax=Hamiltosporidium magnivora TaxID=148818 RepID=A0A4Q9L2R7_9MICR|nr:hypothetical protein CWI39_3473p0010 [Hamiltosporidium magnivora]TBU01727.1 hypothetical protein CWI36_1273p0010 [Hamiltosporidium magnivora]
MLCMDPLSRKLNEKYTKVKIQNDEYSLYQSYLVIDNLMNLALGSYTLEAMAD